MTELRIRKLARRVFDFLRRFARANGQKPKADAADLLCREAMRPETELANELRQMQAELRKKYGRFKDSTALVREERDRRG